MIPKGAAVSEDARCTWTRGEAGFEVNMKAGKSAICCSLYGGGMSVGTGGRPSSSREWCEGEGEGGSRIVA